MGRRGNNRRSGNTAEDRARQQQANKEHRSALVKKMQAKAMERATLANSKEEEVPEPRFQRDGDAYLSTLASTPLRRVGSSSSARIAPWYQTFIELALQSMNDGDAQVVMSWPFAQTCSSGIASLVAIAAVSSAKPRISIFRVNVSWLSSRRTNFARFFFPMPGIRIPRRGRCK